MASSLAAITTGGGGLVSTADSSGNLDLKSGTTTIVALTSAGVAVTGTMSTTGTTTVNAGTAALPAIVSTTGTADTGLWFPAADTVAASTGGTERLRIDSSGNVLVTSAAGLGYGTGSGGTVTQATSKSTNVTLNKPTGVVTMNNAALASNTTVAFQCFNSTAASIDTVVLTPLTSLIDMSFYQYWAAMNGPGSIVMYLRNITGGSLSDAVVFNFAIIKGATS